MTDEQKIFLYLLWANECDRPIWVEYRAKAAHRYKADPVERLEGPVYGNYVTTRELDGRHFASLTAAGVHYGDCHHESLEPLLWKKLESPGEYMFDYSRDEFGNLMILEIWE